MVAEGLGRRPTPKARAKGALEKFGLFGRHWARALPTARRFALASFQGRVIRELDGDRVRVLFFDSEATYDRSQLTDAGVSVNPVREHTRSLGKSLAFLDVIRVIGLQVERGEVVAVEAVFRGAEWREAGIFQGRILSPRRAPSARCPGGRAGPRPPGAFVRYTVPGRAPSAQ
jgi:hypothetical protein